MSHNTNQHNPTANNSGQLLYKVRMKQKAQCYLLPHIYLFSVQLVKNKNKKKQVEHHISLVYFAQWLTVFTLTPSFDVCLVVRLKPSILLASSPTTAGLREIGSGLKQFKQYPFKKLQSLFRKHTPHKMKDEKRKWTNWWICISLSLCSVEKRYASALSGL